ncbi:MAG: peptidoglycan DD-metalloendopeptidase family protein [Nitriliruptoraceae bacterium]|nr:peptidoglycan DD-metalloendopeptidase family protein [Nitriliruptoraceae bacterium]
MPDVARAAFGAVTRLPRLVLAAVLVVPLVAIPLVAIPVVAGASDLDSARDRATQLRDDLEAATTRYEELRGQIERSEDELESLDRRAAELEATAAALDEALEGRARQVFMRGSTAGLELLLAGDGPDTAIERAALAEAVQSRDTAGLEEAVAARVALDSTVLLAEQRRTELDELRVEAAAVQAQLEDDLDRAETTVASLEEIAARQRTIDRGSQQGVYACPLDRHLTHFIDSWGFPRSGGRSHRGTDIMGPMGVPVYAFTDGVISRHSNSRLGGISLYLRGDDGNTYFYTHLQGYAPRGAVGTRVAAGEHIAYNGDTGNARGGPPHIHFEQYPGGGAAINPYPYLAAVCF